MCLAAQMMMYCLVQKHYAKKNKEEAVEHVKILTKRMNEVKEKYQEQTAKRSRLETSL